jgi:hypothetical protein
MDPDPDPSIFIMDPQNGNKKLIFQKVFLHSTLIFEGTFTSFLKEKDKKSKRSLKTVEIKVFLTIFA